MFHSFLNVVLQLQLELALYARGSASERSTHGQTKIGRKIPPMLNM